MTHRVYPGTPRWRNGKLETNERIVPLVKWTNTCCDYTYVLEHRPLPICPGCLQWIEN